MQDVTVPRTPPWRNNWVLSVAHAVTLSATRPPSFFPFRIFGKHLDRQSGAKPQSPRVLSAVRVGHPLVLASLPGSGDPSRALTWVTRGLLLGAPSHPLSRLFPNTHPPPHHHPPHLPPPPHLHPRRGRSGPSSVGPVGVIARVAWSGLHISGKVRSIPVPRLTVALHVRRKRAVFVSLCSVHCAFSGFRLLHGFSSRGPTGEHFPLARPLTVREVPVVARARSQRGIGTSREHRHFAIHVQLYPLGFT